MLEREHARVRNRTGQAARGFDAVELRHSHIHHHYVWANLFGQRENLAAVGGFSHDLHVRLRVQNHFETLAHHGMIVSQQDAYAFHGEAGCAPQLQHPRPIARELWPRRPRHGRAR